LVGGAIAAISVAKRQDMLEDGLAASATNNKEIFGRPYPGKGTANRNRESTCQTHTSQPQPQDQDLKVKNSVYAPNIYLAPEIRLSLPSMFPPFLLSSFPPFPSPISPIPLPCTSY
jgi:hypothetical protein